jgi:hypothetical protein
MKDIEAQSPTSQSNPHIQNQQEIPKCQIGSLTFLYIILSVVIYCFQLNTKLLFIPNQVTFWNFGLYIFFPFAVQTSGLLVNLIILLFFSTFFEKKFGTMGFFLKMEFCKFLFALLCLGIHKFLTFVHLSPVFSKMLTIGNFAMLFMIFVSHEAFERPNDFSMIPVVNLSFKNVRQPLHKISFIQN